MNVINDNIINDILRKERQITEIVNIDWNITKNTAKNTNFNSEASKLTIEYENEDGKPYKKSLFLKVPSNAPMHENCLKFGIYEREFLMYTKILPEMRKLVGDEELSPKFYLGDDKHSLILEDLTELGYKLANRVQQLDFEHCRMALINLAKFHAFSAKLNETGSIVDCVKEDPYRNANNDEGFKFMFGAGYSNFLRHLEPSLKERYSKKLHEYQHILLDRIVADVNAEDDAIKVLNHGDFWTGNIMFKYNKFGIVENVRLIDFQISRWASPAIDIIQFMVTSMRFEVYENHFDLLLEIYLDTFNNTLEYLGCDTYSMEDLRNDIDRKFFFAFGGIACIVPIILSAADESIDVAEVIKEKESSINGSQAMSKAFAEERSKQIVKKWFLHYAQRGYFDD